MPMTHELRQLPVVADAAQLVTVAYACAQSEVPSCCWQDAAEAEVAEYVPPGHAQATKPAHGVLRALICEEQAFSMHAVHVAASALSVGPASCWDWATLLS